MNPVFRSILSLLFLAGLLGACSPQPAAPAADMPNPASANCVQKGGRLEMRMQAELGEYGVCFFDDGLACEEWTLMRGECPEGGVDISAYATEAAAFCALTGGQYAVTANSGALDEQGTCTFPNGAVCDIWDYFNGTCSK